MSERFDVVVVGARCAGAPLAADLAARGLAVCVLDRARFPSDVPSTHAIQPAGVARLERLGVLDSVLATGAPPIERVTFHLDEVRLCADEAVMNRLEARPLCVRRSTLDPLLAGRAAEAGAEVRLETPVTGLLTGDGRTVRGVRTGKYVIEAPVVIGADGPSSAVARFTGARKYHVTEPARLFLWAYFEGASDDGHAQLGQAGDLAFLGMPTDSGLYLASVAPLLNRKTDYLGDLDRTYHRAVAELDQLGSQLATARRVGPIRVMARWHGYFRESAGRGWALVGDAGHFKDPAPAQGISDAMRQGEHLAEAIARGLDLGRVDRELRAWWRWRDEDAWGMYWFAAELGSATPRIAREIFRELASEPDGPETLMRILSHEVDPSSVFSPSRAGRTLLRSGAAEPRFMPQLLAETAALARDRTRRAWLRHRPRFITESGADSGARA